MEFSVFSFLDQVIPNLITYLMISHKHYKKNLQKRASVSYWILRRFEYKIIVIKRAQKNRIGLMTLAISKHLPIYPCSCSEHWIKHFWGCKTLVVNATQNNTIHNVTRSIYQNEENLNLSIYIYIYILFNVVNIFSDICIIYIDIYI